MANAGCINAIWFDWTYLRTLDTLDSANIGVGVQYCIPAPLDDKRLDYIKYTDKCGCTCCITGENEILVYATNWVLKNFTLTNNDTNEVVNVKWNDLFGSNRAYTMVRYKTGSYPTSITDGTLAVKETTQNQYATSWYNVSWLTDWTTYYFTAFAVSQDGIIIVVQNKTITTSFILVQTFDFQNQGALWRTWVAIWYWTPDYVSWQWRKIWTSTSWWYQWNITPPNSLYQRTLQKVKIRFSHPRMTTRYAWNAVWITDTDSKPMIEYWRNQSWDNNWLNVSDYRIQIANTTWETIMEIIFWESSNVSVKITVWWTTYTYDWWSRAADYLTMWNNKTLRLEIARWSSDAHYIRKVEFTSR